MQTPVIESISPDKAEKYLNRNTSNRKLRDGVVDKYAHDMKNDNWTECIAPIAFYENGDVADGQHRLWAIIESGKTQKFYVLRNVSRDAGLNIDTGLSRTVVDNARISGMDTGLTNELVSVARAAEYGTRQRDAIPNSLKLDIVEKHRAAGDWACAHGPRGMSIRNQCTLAAVARAWYHETDKEKLSRFCKVLSTGVVSGEHETAAIALRNHLQTKRNAHLNQVFNETFLKVQNAIEHFMNDKPMAFARVPRAEPYALPRNKLPVLEYTPVRHNRAKRGSKVKS